MGNGRALFRSSYEEHFFPKSPKEATLEKIVNA